ncbi:DNA helicase [Tanacetum coccineum]|uniref:ATP-dependent DNA helicase n=1 Tax=Tanacetum coccineum TaxID=301880 RepID=A0ABQ4ZWM4_9ASTR
MRHFGGLDNRNLDPETIQGLIHFLDTHNELVQLFRTARDICREIDIPEFKIRLYNGDGPRGYELLALNTLGAIVFENGLTSTMDFDVIIKHRGGPPKRINKLHQSYMSLQFPLLFIYGKLGFYTELKLRRANDSGEERRVTMLAYYAYQLHPRVSEYNLIFRGGRLFQQYVVGVFCCTEQNRLDFIRKKQNDIRSDYLSGLYDAISRGERDSFEVGDRIILPMSFTGGASIYVCTLLRRFSYFSEARYCLSVLNTVEFQKHGLPDSVSKIQEPKDVDQVISAELPDPQIDPYGYKVVSEMMIHGPCGAVNLSATCMQGDKCIKSFPKKDKDRLESVVNLLGRKSTTLTEWFAYNATNEDKRHLTYLDFPSEFVWYDDRKSWWPRQNSRSSVGRLAYVHPTLGLLDMLANRLLMEERNYNQEELQQQKAESVPRLNGPQRKIYDLIIDANAANQQELIFVYGHGDTYLIIWDEAPMNDRHCFEALDKTLRDILTMPHRLFGGKSVLLGIDFRQTLPVKKGASKMEVIASCISESDLWPHFRVFTLIENMRLSRPGVSADEHNLISSFASWLIDIRDGKTGEPD